MRILKNNSRKNKLIKYLRSLDLEAKELSIRKEELDKLEFNINDYHNLKWDREGLNSDANRYMQMIEDFNKEREPLLEIKHRYFELLEQLDIKEAK